MRHLLLGVAALALTACASTEPADDSFAEMFGGVPADRAARVAATASAHPLGSRENPVRVNMPAGQRAYLYRLRCANGRIPTFERSGSFGPGPYGTIIDGYVVQCAGSQPANSLIFMDMYHPTHNETKAPPGFTIVQ